MKKRKFYIFLGIAVALWLNAMVVWGEDDPEGLVSKEAKARRLLIHKGISYLVSLHQDEDLLAKEQYRATVTALSGLALLGAGYHPSRGPYHEELQKMIDRFIKVQRKDGYISLGDNRSMYGHGFSTLFLAEAYGMSSDKKVHTALKKAIDFIVAQQNERGGWNYEPDKGDEGSVTIVQIQALRAARNVGIEISREAIEKSIQYVKKSQYPNGSIGYQSGPSGNGTVALTAAGMAVLFNAGEYDLEDEVKQKGFSFLDNNISYELNASHFLYTHFYAAQVYKQRGSMYFSSYFSRIEKVLFSRIEGVVEKGNKLNIDNLGEIYSMAMSLLILETSLDYLPIFTD